MLMKILLSTLLCTTLTTPLIGKVNAEEVKQDKPVKYVFHNGGNSGVIINLDGSMTIPDPNGDHWDVVGMPVDLYVKKNGVDTDELTPKYKHIWDQWAYYDFYASKGRTADLFVGEHPRPLDGEIFVPKYDNTSDNTKVDDKIDNQNNVNDKNNDKKDEPKNDQTVPNKNTTDNQSMTEQPKQDVPAKVEQPAKVDKNSDTHSNVVDKKDTANQNKANTNKDNKAISNNKSNDQNKVAMNNQKSDPQSSDSSKKVDMKKEDNNKDLKAKATDNKAKSDKQQKELPKTGESDSTWLRNGLVILSALIFLGIYRLSRKYEV
ncbi:LPXTG cell wall anchor domain-containing protein [Mammaliicoccus sp. I-M35]|uniref:LPXTG cell wall anchor domain-containing protein n=1 Tax=Mammaliicoccus sp. I-M35 TaxID=2898694 RepID=UPI001EFB46EC|nr:LPXTG cell wall anchor domain-containing protein [Mammaliicoccus sp. I-M35]